MTRTITAYFDTPSEADMAAERLTALGVMRGDVTVVAEGEGEATMPTHRAEPKSFFEKIGDFFIPDDDRSTYEEGIRRGGAILTARVEDSQFDSVCDSLEGSGAADLDTRESEWRAAGWSSPQVSGSTADVESGYVPVAEEQLRVGKREVNHGRVRIRSYVVETPVEESVQLRDETVSVDRRPVDRAATSADELFTDRTIEAEEHDEEAVVSKEARVTEEVRLRKDVDEREETVSDTVRRTKVDVEDERTSLGASAGASRRDKRD